MTEEYEDPRIGMLVQERYRILRKIGDGGMGSVYEGEHVVIRKRVAIKVLHPQFAMRTETAVRFQREAQAATAIGHPNIIEVTDMGRFPDGTAYMVLEFLEGRDFAHVITTEGPQPLGRVVHILSQVCDGVGAAHAKGIVHRDLKPENIFLVERGGDPNFVKVLDFGISKIADGRDGGALTQTGSVLGTPIYMAPEQCQGRKDIDARTDIYALGVILFWALTQRYPFEDVSFPMLVVRICTENPPPLSTFRSDLPREIEELFSRMVAKDRDHRIASCSEVKAALEPFRNAHIAPTLVIAPNLANRPPLVLQAGAPAGNPAWPATHTPGTGPPAQPTTATHAGSTRLLLGIGALFVLLLGGSILLVLALTQSGAGRGVLPLGSALGERCGETSRCPDPNTQICDLPTNECRESESVANADIFFPDGTHRSYAVASFQHVEFRETPPSSNSLGESSSFGFSFGRGMLQVGIAWVRHPERGVAYPFYSFRDDDGPSRDQVLLQFGSASDWPGRYRGDYSAVEGTLTFDQLDWRFGGSASGVVRATVRGGSGPQPVTLRVRMRFRFRIAR